jgi:ABC-2 type transport system ATP-binding protein
MRVEFQNIVKKYDGKTVLSIPSWKADPGEIVGLVGSNGAGKTTFLRLLLDLLEADEGRILIDEKPVSGRDGWKRRTGSFLDSSFLIDFLTATEYFRFVASLYGFRNGECRSELDPYRNMLPFISSDSAEGLIREMSTGNAKRVGIVAAMFVCPRLLILDEPFANLDPPSQIRLKEHILRISSAKKTTMIISSHDLGHVTEVCSRITLLDSGLVVRDEEKSDATLSDLKDYFTSLS